MNVFKTIIVTLLMSLLLVGCVSDQQQQQTYDNTSEGIIFKSNFNQENYIWESFIFPENKTTGK